MLAFEQKLVLLAGSRGWSSVTRRRGAFAAFHLADQAGSAGSV